MSPGLAEAVNVDLPPDLGRQTKVVLLNGPPRCGKDTAALGLQQGLHGKHKIRLHKFAAPLVAGVRGVFGISEARWTYLYATAKEIKTEELGGMSPREAMIWMSEEVMKPKFGNAIFGRIAADQIAEMPPGVVVVSDCGFCEEIVPMAGLLGWENILILQLFRPGCTFASDSRSYITPEVLAPYLPSSPFHQPEFRHVINRTDLFTFREDVCSVVTLWLDGL